jgi:elongation factor P
VDTFEPADLRQKKMQYLYQEQGKYCFMDSESYEQVFLTEDQVGEAKNFLIDNLEAEILFFEDKPLEVSLPNFVDLVVIRADPWAKGDSVSGKTKPVTLQTGYQIQVPPFVEEGEKIRVDTRSGEYLTRVKD